jgi:tetratricopeptide (TPR) repeat protein
MMTPSLESTLTNYAEALQRLEEFYSANNSPNLPQSPSKEQTILEVLSYRDRVQRALEDSKNAESITNGIALNRLSQLDQQLRKQAPAIAPYTQSADWRASFNPNPEAWWWTIEAPKQGWSDRIDWLWSAVTVIALTISLGLLGDIAPRFLTGGPDSWGAFTVSAQSVLTLLAAGSALTKPGQESLRRLLESIKLAPKYWHEVGAASATHFYTNPGTQNRQKGDWGTAEAQLQRAIKLNADDAQAHFQLGNLYEDLQQTDKALPHYQLAISGGIPAATNNLARLNILKKDYSAAVSLLLKALDNDKRQPLDHHIKHAVLKNLGWARLKQKNYPDAEAKLEDAIDLETKTQFQPFEIADSHCLLAQVLEAQGSKTEALREWKICNSNANITIPEQDEWVTMAGTASKRLIPKEPRK